MTGLTGGTPIVSPFKRNGNDSAVTVKKLVIHLKNMSQVNVSSGFFNLMKNFSYSMEY